MTTLTTYNTTLAVLAIAIVLVACVLTTRRCGEHFEAANERPVYWRTA